MKSGSGNYIRKAVMRCSSIFQILLLVNAPIFLSESTWAQGDKVTTIQTEQSKLMKAPNAYAKIGTDLFGDSVNLYNGGLSFVQTDVSLPGNNSLPMSVSRRLVAGRVAPRDNHFGQWELEIPRLHGIFSNIGWTVSSTPENILKRCTVISPPPTVSANFGTLGLFSATEYWHGNFLYVPGAGDQEILSRNTTQNPNVPTDGLNYPHVTKELWALTCTSLLSGEGEGFIAVAPNGTRYYFDHMVSRPMEILEKPFPNPISFAKSSGLMPPPRASSEGSPQLQRKEVWILPSKVVDKYGNSVTYTYNATNKWQLTKMLASDGRQIDITYVSGTNHIQSVYDGSRTWTYSYSGTAFPETQTLDTVTQPDGSTWKFAGMAALADYNVGYVAGANCSSPGTVINQPLVGTMTHPSGAVGEFTLQPIRHGRSKVYQQCIVYGTDGSSSYQKYAKEFDSYSLVNKTVQGPGLSPLVWTYDFNPNNVTGEAFASWETCASNCGGKKWVKVTDPKKNVTLHTFGNVFNVDEGQSQKVEVMQWNPVAQAATEVVSTTTTNYKIYSSTIGDSFQNRAENFLSRRYTPVEQRVTTQQGASFTWKADAFDVAIPRPTTVTRSNSLGMSRAESTVYVDKKPKWVISLTQKVTESSTGKIVVENTHDAFGDVLTTKNFGILDKTFTYNAEGNLYSVKIGAATDTTVYSSYKRGKPQSIKYAGGGTETLVVNNVGFVTTLTGEAGFVSSFEPDSMGRIKKVNYPTGDTPAWNPTNVDFQQVVSEEYGLASGHWRQMVTTGNAQTITYLDALWRPVLTRTVDITNPSATSQMVVSQFDHNGNAIYTSYPQREIASISATPAGTYTSYDALGRVVSTTSNSELGNLTTQVNYLNGFKKSVTNPKGQVTTTEFTGFDEPTENFPIKITAPEGLTVDFTRDIFGKTTSVTRSGGGKNAVRRYVYDTNERLCKTIEPELGATLQAYDTSNNIAWKAVHATLTSPICDRGSVPAAKKVTFTYTTRQQLWETKFGDNTTNIVRNYTIDGLPSTISSFGATWTSAYNKRRLPTSETLTSQSVSYPLTYTYTANAHLSTLKYPDGKVIDYVPNALGQASKVGTHATGITYHPNGAVASFTYGNGITHTLQQNLRGLPQVSTDTGILQDTYSYDENANVMSIIDGTSNNTSRAMTYDNLDRLKTVNAPGIWGNASYNYDVLDNITQSVIGGRTNVHNYDATKNRLTSITSNDAAFNLNYDSYDENGNIKKRGSQLFSFDLLNRLSIATGKATYSYDGLGHRFKVVSADATNLIQVYSPAGQLLWTKQSGGPKPAKETRYIYLNRHVIAEVEVAR